MSKRLDSLHGNKVFFLRVDTEWDPSNISYRVLKTNMILIKRSSECHYFYPRFEVFPLFFIFSYILGFLFLSFSFITFSVLYSIVISFLNSSSLVLVIFIDEGYLLSCLNSSASCDKTFSNIHLQILSYENLARCTFYQYNKGN